VVIVVVGGPPFVGHSGPVRASVRSNVDGAPSTKPTVALRLTFSLPLDHTATASAIRLAPATQVRSTWDGETLTVTPVHAFAPNSAYVLTIDHTVARTALGAPLAADMHVLFGTAPVAAWAPSGNPTMMAPLPLVPTPVADADDGSDAVVARDGTLLLTAARAGPGTGGHEGLVRISGGTAAQLSMATDAICVSRSGRSVAYLSHTDAGTRVVFADGVGSPSTTVPAQVDRHSPLGWINDAEVIFVGGGRLRAIDREGRVRILSDTAVNAAQDRVVPSPGGRYVYLRSGSGGTGRVVDLGANTVHALPGSTGDVAFSADGATVAWFDDSTGTPALDVAASAGGPVLTIALPVVSGQQLSDLALSPDAYHFVYSVATPGHGSELRLSTLPDGGTIAMADGDVGHSPHWSASGNLFTVRTVTVGGSRIDTVPVPDPDTDRQAELEGLAAAFANGEVGADAGAQRALAAADTALPALPAVTRAAVLWVTSAPNGTASARLRLTIDPRPDAPTARQAEETLTLGPRPSDGTLAVRAVNLEDFHPAPAAPQIVRCDTESQPGTVLLTFDSDLDPQTVPSAVRLSTMDGAAVPATVSYDAVNRTVVVRPDSTDTTSVLVRVDTALRDVRGQRPAREIRVVMNLSG
jgi:hypothetical protein